MENSNGSTYSDIYTFSKCFCFILLECGLFISSRSIFSLSWFNNWTMLKRFILATEELQNRFFFSNECKFCVEMNMVKPMVKQKSPENSFEIRNTKYEMSLLKIISCTLRHTSIIRTAVINIYCIFGDRALNILHKWLIF